MTLLLWKDARKGKIGKLRSFGIWALEMLCAAIGTTLWVTTLAFIQAEPGSRNDATFPVIIGLSAFVVIEFALTGYVLTTVLLCLYLPRRQRFFYPLFSSCLYLIHYEIFFVALGNRILDKHDLCIQIGGMFITLVITTVGDFARAFPRQSS